MLEEHSAVAYLIAYAAGDEAVLEYPLQLLGVRSQHLPRRQVKHNAGAMRPCLCRRGSQQSRLVQCVGTQEQPGWRQAAQCGQLFRFALSFGHAALFGCAAMYCCSA